jgi:hypothetical protein
MKELGGLRKIDQDIRLRRTASGTFARLASDLSVESSHPASHLLQLCAQGFEGSPVFLPEHRKSFDRFGFERGAGIVGRSLYEIVERIADFLGCLDSIADRIVIATGFRCAHGAAAAT